MKATEFQQAGGVEDWRVLGSGASTWFDAPSQTAGATLVGRIADLAPVLPDLDLRAGGVRVRIGASSDLDVELARAISAAAQDLGLPADPAALQTVHFAIDSVDFGSEGPFDTLDAALEARNLLQPTNATVSISFLTPGQRRRRRRHRE